MANTYKTFVNLLGKPVRLDGDMPSSSHKVTRTMYHLNRGLIVNGKINFVGMTQQGELIQN